MLPALRRAWLTLTPVPAFAPADAGFPLAPALGRGPEPALGVLLPGFGVVLSDGDGGGEVVLALGLVVDVVG